MVSSVRWASKTFFTSIISISSSFLTGCQSTLKTNDYQFKEAHMMNSLTINNNANNKFGTNNIRVIRKEKGLTQTELADALGMTKQAICYLENGQVSRLTAERIASYLGVSVIRLMGLDTFKFVPTTPEEKLYLINLIINIDTEQKE